MASRVGLCRVDGVLVFVQCRLWLGHWHCFVVGLTLPHGVDQRTVIRRHRVPFDKTTDEQIQEYDEALRWIYTTQWCEFQRV